MAALTQLYHPLGDPPSTHTSSYPLISPSNYRVNLNGKVALIIRVERFICRQSALALVAAGARFACISHTQSDLDELFTEIRESDRVEYQPWSELPRNYSGRGDVADPSFAPKAVEETETKLGRVNILINNAGLSRVSDLEHATLFARRPWRVVEVSLLGSMFFRQAVLPSMIARHEGVILKVFSIIGRVTVPYFSTYSTAKAGLIKYTEVVDWS